MQLFSKGLTSDQQIDHKQRIIGPIQNLKKKN